MIEHNKINNIKNHSVYLYVNKDFLDFWTLDFDWPKKAISKSLHTWVLFGGSKINLLLYFWNFSVTASDKWPNPINIVFRILK